MSYRVPLTFLSSQYYVDMIRALSDTSDGCTASETTSLLPRKDSSVPFLQPSSSSLLSLEARSAVPCALVKLAHPESQANILPVIVTNHTVTIAAELVSRLFLLCNVSLCSTLDFYTVV